MNEDWVCFLLSWQYERMYWHISIRVILCDSKSLIVGECTLVSSDLCFRLLLARGHVWVKWISHCDNSRYKGIPDYVPCSCYVRGFGNHDDPGV